MRISGFGTGSRFPYEIFFGESLLPGFRFPVVISYTSSVDDNPATKLSEHRSGSDNCDIPGAVGKWQDFLLNQILFLGLGCNNSAQRPVFVQQKIRISIA
jgi:hypothetical protein